MFHNLFREPKPKGLAEINEAIDETGTDPSTSTALLHFDEGDEGPFKGWFAEVLDDESGEPKFSTLGYDDKAALVGDLKRAGFTKFEESQS